MTSARRKSDSTSPWLRLYEELKSAVADEVICCPRSSIVESEAALSARAEDIVQLASDLGDPHLRHELGVRRAQLCRALQRFLNDEPPVAETDLSEKDAFEGNVHRWLPTFRIDVKMIPTDDGAASLRNSKQAIHNDCVQIYRRYEDEGLSYEAIRRLEQYGYGRGLAREGMRCLRKRLGIDPVESPDDLLATALPNELDLLIYLIREKTGQPFLQALNRAVQFLESDHVALLPLATLGAKLHAALAIAVRGPTGRKPIPSDSQDINHIATYMPYMDVFVADKHFAALCNQDNLRLGDDYDTQIRALNESEIDQFVVEIKEMVSRAPQSELARQIARAISEGGYHQEISQKLCSFRTQQEDPTDISRK